MYTYGHNMASSPNGHEIDKLAQVLGHENFRSIMEKTDVLAVPIISETDSSYLYQKQVNFRYLPQHDEFLSFARERKLKIKRPEIYDKDLDKSDYQTFEIIARFILSKAALPVLVKFVKSRIKELNTDGYYKIENVAVRFYYLEDGEEHTVIPCRYEGSLKDFGVFVENLVEPLKEMED